MQFPVKNPKIRVLCYNLNLGVFSNKENVHNWFEHYVIFTYSNYVIIVSLIFFFVADYALVPDSSGMGVLASPNFPFTHCWGNYSYTLFAGKPHNVCFK